MSTSEPQKPRFARPASNRPPITPTSPSSSYKLRKEIFQWDKNDRGDKTRVNVAETSNGNLYLDIRHWFTHKDTGELCPGKGVSIPIIDDNIDQLLAAMEIVADQWENGDLLK